MINTREDNKSKELLNLFLSNKPLTQEMLQKMINVFNFSPEKQDEALNEDKIYLTNPPIDFNLNSNYQSLLNKKRKSQDPIQVKEESNNSNIKNKIIKQNYNFITQTKTNDKTLKSNLEDSSPLKLEQEIQFSKVSYRLDYYKKAFKVNCFKYLTDSLNALLKPLPKELSGEKFFKPNHDSFTSNVKEKDNLIFLSMTLKKAFTYYIRSDKKVKGIKKQEKNENLINNIFNYEPKNKNDLSQLEELKKYLNKTVEKHIELYYESESFKSFSREEKIKFFDKEFLNEKGFSMLQENGFIKLIKNTNDIFSNDLSSIHQKMDGIIFV